MIKNEENYISQINKLGEEKVKKDAEYKGKVSKLQKDISNMNGEMNKLSKTVQEYASKIN